MIKAVNFSVRLFRIETKYSLSLQVSLPHGFLRFVSVAVFFKLFFFLIILNCVCVCLCLCVCVCV